VTEKCREEQCFTCVSRRRGVSVDKKNYIRRGDNVDQKKLTRRGDNVNKKNYIRRGDDVDKKKLKLTGLLNFVNMNEL
jgi:hypothetical protein